MLIHDLVHEYLCNDVTMYVDIKGYFSRDFFNLLTYTQFYNNMIAIFENIWFKHKLPASWKWQILK